MVGELFGNLITCGTCKHGIGAHDGAGCHTQGCRCKETMQTVLDQNIAISTREFQQMYRQPE